MIHTKLYNVADVLSDYIFRVYEHRYVYWCYIQRSISFLFQQMAVCRQKMNVLSFGCIIDCFFFFFAYLGKWLLLLLI